MTFAQTTRCQSILPLTSRFQASFGFISDRPVFLCVIPFLCVLLVCSWYVMFPIFHSYTFIQEFISYVRNNKVKLSKGLTNDHAMETYEGVEV